MKQSLGLLEVSGLALAISCADVMAKAASITLVGLEKTNGSGWTVIKITGDVASVQAAIITGASFAEQQEGLVAHKVIARPGEGILDRAVASGTGAPTAVLPINEPEALAIAAPQAQAVATTAPEAPTAEPQPQQAPEQEKPQPQREDGVISCNLCLDPACTRQKGEPRSLCLHAGK